MDFEGAYSVQNKDLGYSATPSARSRRVTEWLPAFQTGFGFFSASGHSTVTERDSVGRVTRIIPPEGESTSLTGDRTVSYGFSGNPWIYQTEHQFVESTRPIVESKGFWLNEL